MSKLETALNPVLEHLLMGLTTDGAQYKQYYLERAVRELTTDEWTEKAKAHFQWKEGVST